MAVRWASALSVAESYLTSEVRDSGPECQGATAQEQPGGATPRLRSGAASEVSGGLEETPHVRRWGRPGEANSHRRPGAVTLRSHPEPEARAGSREEQPDEQWLSRHRKA